MKMYFKRKLMNYLKSNRRKHTIDSADLSVGRSRDRLTTVVSRLQLTNVL